MEAAYHPKQPERLAALRSYEILDTPREEEFDDVVKLASQICETPISVINLIDRDRQWFKAEVGLGATETPLETSICAHVILSEDFVIIEDTQADSRTADNELCAPEDGLRFYAGALLKTQNGLPIGTLCVLDNKPRKLNEHQRFAIKVLAQRVMRELELRRSLKTQDILRDEMDHRIKNSLASIASTVRLREREATQTGDTKEAFDAIQRQLNAVAAIHEGIYCSAGTDVNALKYLVSLTNSLEASLPRHVSVSATGTDIVISPDLASTFGLIVNEFAANTLKHGKESHTGVTLEFTLAHHNESLELTCRNNLATRTSEIDDAPSGIGARLMQASVAKHGGELEETPSKAGHLLKVIIPFSHS